MTLDEKIEKAKERIAPYIGQQFGELTIKGYADYRGKHAYVFCDCECGTKGKIFCFASVKSGHVKSCGCKQAKQRDRVRGGSVAKVCKKPAQKPKEKQERKYSHEILTGLGTDFTARRIEALWKTLPADELCIAWHSPRAFVSWAIRNGFVNGKTLRRPNAGKPYSPLNAVWEEKE